MNTTAATATTPAATICAAAGTVRVSRAARKNRSSATTNHIGDCNVPYSTARAASSGSTGSPKTTAIAP